jgi:hypothetical protein
MDTVSEDEEPPERGDEFTSAKKRLFLLALRKGESALAACRLVGISNRTAYNHRETGPEFARFWKLARSMATLPLDLVAWERGVVGVEEPVYAYGKFSHMRLRRSDMVLRKLLEAEHPKRYMRARPPPGRQRVLGAVRDQIRREIYAEIRSRMPSFEQSLEELGKALDAFAKWEELHGRPPTEEDDWAPRPPPDEFGEPNGGEPSRKPKKP